MPADERHTQAFMPQRIAQRAWGVCRFLWKTGLVSLLL